MKHTHLVLTGEEKDLIVLSESETENFLIARVSDRGTPRLITDRKRVAAFMVHAANNHDALLAACKLALGAFENNNCIDWNILTQVIANAEKGEI